MEDWTKEKNANQQIEPARTQMLIEMSIENHKNPQFARGRRFAQCYVGTWSLTLLFIRSLLMIGAIVSFASSSKDGAALLQLCTEFFPFIIVVALVIPAVYCVWVQNDTAFSGLVMIATSGLFLGGLVSRLDSSFSLVLYGLTVVLVFLGVLMLYQKSIKVYRRRAQQIASRYGQHPVLHGFL